MIKGDILGDGTYGIVYSCKQSDTGKRYALKRNLAEKNISFLNSIRETDLLTKLREHPHIVTLEFISYKSPFEVGFEPLVCKDYGSKDHPCKHAVCRNRKDQRDDGIHFIFEEASDNLYQYIKNNDIDYGLLKRYMVQILLGVEYMHEHSIIHCDLKPQNILIFEDKVDVLGTKNIAQICDFGLSLPYTYQGNQLPNVVTSWYRAPEIILGYPHYDCKSDVWSVGCILFEMVAKVQFLAGSPEGHNNLISKILGSLPEEIPMKTMRLIKANKWRNIKLFEYHKVPKKKRKSWITQLGLSVDETLAFKEQAGDIDLFSDLLEQMFQVDWDTRNSITECIEHPFFEDQRLLIDETRKLYNPTQSFERLMYIVPCQERIWLKEAVNNIYHDKLKLKKWYNDRTLFQALSLFDSYMSGIYEDKDYKEPVFTKYETLLKFYSFLYLCIKYFTVIDCNICFDDVFEKEYRTEEAKSEIEKFEMAIIQKMEHNIYRTSVYEAADKFSIFLDDNQILKLLNAYLNVNRVLVTTPSEFVQNNL